MKVHFKDYIFLCVPALDPGKYAGNKLELLRHPPDCFHCWEILVWLEVLLIVDSQFQYDANFKSKNSRRVLYESIESELVRSCCWDHGRVWGSRGGWQHPQPDLRGEEQQGEAALPPLVPQQRGNNTGSCSRTFSTMLLILNGNVIIIFAILHCALYVYCSSCSKKFIFTE